jgi:hypothetical protein
MRGFQNNASMAMWTTTTITGTSARYSGESLD